MKRRKPFVSLSVCCLSLLFAAAAVSAQEVKLSAAQAKMTTASAVRARNAPQVAATEVTRLKLGTVLSAVARSADEFEVGGKKDYWYRVNLPTGEAGWVYGGLLTDYDPARRVEILGRVIGERLKVEGMNFEDGTDLYNFVSGALAEAREPQARAEYELLKLQALGHSMSAVPFGERERPPYRDWHKAHEQELVYSEPSGQWLVRSELFWELERKYHGSPAGERIAWEAAQNPLPGECESDEVCGFLYLNDTEGRYLGLYPNGAHAAEALKNIDEALASQELESMLNSKSRDKYVVEQRAELRKALTGLRVAVSKTSSAEKASILKKLDRLVPRGR